MFKIFKSKKKLLKEMADLENRIIERERKNFFNEKIALINEYEARIIRDSQIAADERELSMLEVIDKKDAKIKSLEIELSEQRNSYRSFKQEIRDYEIITEELSTALEIGTTTIAQLQGRFNFVRDKMIRVVEKIEKKDRKLIEKVGE
jgi:chromosome segregation ATPase